MATATRLRSVLVQARLAQVLTLGWMMVEACVAIGSGIAARSVALTAFGGDSLIELFSAGVVLRQLLTLADLTGETELSQGERQASRLVGMALCGVIGFILLSSGVALLFGIHPEPSGPGLWLTLAAIVVMIPLWRWRLRLADRLGSPALKGDAVCSAVCLYMAGTTLAGLAVNRLLGWWWADPLAALVLVWWIRGEAVEALAAARASRRCEEDCCGS